MWLHQYYRYCPYKISISANIEILAVNIDEVGPVITFALSINPRHFCYFLSLRPKYSPLESVRKQPQSI